jgi:demethylmenaquinone methyltransferase/2-methoxy-6-polyprenyl-1,4-benzoquinol methylase
LSGFQQLPLRGKDPFLDFHYPVQSVNLQHTQKKSEIPEMTDNQEAEWFGTRKVDPKEKTGLVGEVFESVADNYDLMNDVMSGGVHRLWKDKLIRMIAPTQGLRYLDVAGGTGDIAFRLHRKTAGQADITVCDINPEMLRVGKNRAIDRGILEGLTWAEGNAEKLPFEDNSFDVYTISFGLRNVTHIDDALKDAWRVLKPGGRFYCLEFSAVKAPVLDKLYDLYSFKFIPRFGSLIAKDRDSYQYLVESIRQFPKQAELKKRLENAGFERTAVRNLSFGVAAIHSGYKPL